jgi:hypothetical protein
VKKSLRWTLGILVVLALFIAGYWWEENWRGRRMWEATCARLRLAGDPIEWKDIIPPPIPDGDNIAMAPILAEVFLHPQTARLTKFAEPLTREPNRHKTSTSVAPIVDRPQAKPMTREDVSELEQWRAYFRSLLQNDAPTISVQAADEVLYYLQPWQSDLQELQQSLQRPLCRWPVPYEHGPPVMLAPLWEAASSLTLHMRPLILATAASGNAEKCMDLVLMYLRLHQAKASGPRGVVRFYEAAIYDHHALHALQHVTTIVQFTDAQLAALQSQLGQISLHQVSEAIQHERVIMTHIMRSPDADALDSWHNFRDVLDWDWLPNMARDMVDDAALIAAANRPQGWTFIDLSAFSDYLQDHVAACVDEKAGTILNTRVASLDTALAKMRGSMNALSLLQNAHFDQYSNCIRLAAHHYAMACEVRLWCAIERLRLKHGSLPHKLEELVPQFLDEVPCDPVNGLPLHYVRKGARDYLLYSVGLDGIDDGGVESTKRDQGDWVWASDPTLIRNPDLERKIAEEKAKQLREEQWKADRVKRDAAWKAKGKAVSSRGAPM